MIYLASHSPRRKELLQQMGVTFKVIDQFVDENFHKNESAEQYVSRLALEKAHDGLSRQTHQYIPVLGSDTAIVHNGMILGKPQNKEHAVAMLLNLSAQTHRVMTAVAITNNKQTEQIISTTEVTFTKLSVVDCERYWATGEPVDKAGSYAIQGKGSLFIEKINGSYSGVMGLPIFETKCLLEKFSIELS